MRMYTNKVIVDGTISEVNDFLNDFGGSSSYKIIDEDCCDISDKKRVILEMTDGEYLVIKNKQSEEK